MLHKLVTAVAHGGHCLETRAHELQGDRHVKQYDVSVILPFNDDEEIIGRAVAALTRYLRDAQLSFEILAVDDDSGDNSQAVLALIRSAHPELRVLRAPARGQGFEAGARAAAGRVLWLIDARAALSPLQPFGRANERILRCQDDLVAVDQRFIVAHRRRCAEALDGVRGQGRRFHHRVIARARKAGLKVAGPGRLLWPAPRWAAPLLSAFSLTRTY